MVDKVRLGAILIGVVLLTFGIVHFGVSAADAQGSQSGSAHSPRADAGSTFTYQGQLKNDGAAVNGSCDFQFGLWDAASFGLQVGVTQTLSAVNVTNGLFTVPLDFGPVFTGEARWLDIAVRCPAGIGSYAPLRPRQSLTPAPYAAYAIGNWGLHGNRGAGPNSFLGTTDNAPLTLGVSNTAILRLIPNSSAPIIIGGYAGNIVDGFGSGSIIAGGGSIYGANIISGANVVWSTIGGGFRNRINGIAAYSAIGGGAGNQISGTTAYSVIGGGTANGIDGFALNSVVGGGANNQISGNASNSVIDGGLLNRISEWASESAIGSGQLNQIGGAANSGVIGSGESNQISGTAAYSAIGSGVANQINGNAGRSAIGGGSANWVSDSADHSAIGGGESNWVGGYANRSVIDGGGLNQIGGYAGYSAIGGGSENQISGLAGYSTIGGGDNNQISGYAPDSAIVGGYHNQISGTAASYSSIGGGSGNTISGTWATIPGGYHNTATGDFSFAAGRQALASHLGAFVWSDSTEADFTSTGNNQFLIRATGGVGINTNTPAPGLFDVNSDVIVRGTEIKLKGRGGGQGNAESAARALVDAGWGGNCIAGCGLYINFNNDYGKTTVGSDLAVEGTMIVPNLGMAGSTQLCRNAANQISDCSSSLRYKNDLADLNLGLDAVARLHPVTFIWKDSGQADLGLVAEEVDRVTPLLTTRNAAGQIEGVKYDRISAILVKGMQEQQAQITDLKAQNSVLEKKNDDLEARITALEQAAHVGSTGGHTENTASLTLLVIGALGGMVTVQKPWRRGQR